MSTPDVSAILSELASGAPWLPGARCRGRAHLFDSKSNREHLSVAAARHDQAITLCKGCPSLARCAQWIDDLEPAERPSGVVAGRVLPVPPTRTSGAKVR